jgi:hypothetical protein
VIPGPRPTVRGGRSAPMLIAPEQEIYAPFPPCTCCTWVCISHRRMRLKYVNTSCALHQGIRLGPA